nr:MAG TPA: hypothetical protein [Caudoviricetes sp.]
MMETSSILTKHIIGLLEMMSTELALHLIQKVKKLVMALCARNGG